MSGVTLVHLVSASYDTAPVKAFVDAYRAHTAGVAHRLLVLVNGFDDRDPSEHLAQFEGTEHQTLRVPPSIIDLNAYAFAARNLDAGALCFVNSNSQPLATGWLARLAEELKGDVGLVGATGSWEAHTTLRPFSRWPKFPNAHVRTNAFMIDRDLMTSLRWPTVTDKRSAWQLESGRNSVTRQVQDRGHRVLVVGQEGAFAPEDWAHSETFRVGEQANLLVADNRTRDWDVADANTRTHLSKLAWGTAALTS